MNNTHRAVLVFLDGTTRTAEAADHKSACIAASNLFHSPWPAGAASIVARVFVSDLTRNILSECDVDTIRQLSWANR